MRLFFYGTLTHHHDNPITRRVMPLLHRGQPGWVRGTLYAVTGPRGCYPVLGSGRGWVRGWVYETAPGFGAATLRLLDDYEGYRPQRPARSEYLRRSVTVRLAGGGRCTAQAYLGSRPPHAGLKPIASGDFAAWVALCGGVPFA